MIETNPVTYEEAISSSYSNLYVNAMEDKMKSMASNGKWELVELPKGSRPIGCKWFYADFLFQTKQILSIHFDIKDLGKASFVMGIKIFQDKTIMCCNCLR